MPTRSAVAAAAAFFTLYYLVYGAAAVLADGYTTRHHLYFDWEPDLPLWPWTAWIYLSLNFMALPMLAKFPTVEKLKPIFLTVAVELAVATLIFLLFPLEDGFRDPPARGGLGLARVIALRHNYLPSLHVALAYTAAFTVGGPFMLAWATLIAVSTLTTHQHHVADVVAGIALAWLCVRLVYRRAQEASREREEDDGEHSRAHQGHGVLR